MTERELMESGVTTTATVNDHPGVIARPPLIFLGFLALGFVLDTIWPVAVVANDVQYPLGAILVVVGVALVTIAIRQFRRAGTNVETPKPAIVLVTDGLYRLSRNPIYIAVSLIHAGIAISADNAWALVGLIPVLIVLHYGVIRREERYLERKFGEEYRRYRTSVRRWL